MPQQTGPDENKPVTYDPEQSVVEINTNQGGRVNFVNFNSIDVSPIDDEQFTTNKATTGERAWVRSPEWGAELTIEFSGGLSSGKRKWIRELIGQKVKVTVRDRSGTADGVTLTDARLVQKPDFSRDDSEPTYEAVFQSPFAEWGSTAQGGESTYEGL